MISWFRLGCLLCCFAAGVNAGADEGSGTVPDCLEVLASVQTQKDLQTLEYCADEFWHHPEKDPQPGSFNSILTLGYRMLEIEPLQEDLYGSMAWLLWSKWVTWHQSSDDMPDGDGRDLEAVALIQRGGRIFPDSASYWSSAVGVIFPLARRYQPHLFPLIIDWALKVDRLGDVEQQIRARLNIGLIYVQMKELAEARVWLKRVLELDPDHPIALRELKKLETIL